MSSPCALPNISPPPRLHPACTSRRVHSFGVSENYIVLMLYPLTIPFERLANGEGFLPQLEWDAAEGSRVVVWDMRLEATRPPSTWRADACWAYHVINCFDEEV